MNFEQLIATGYEIENAKITDVDLSMTDHGWFTLYMPIEGNGWRCCYGGICLGHGYLGASKFESSSKCGEYIMRIMDVVGVDKFQNLKGKYIRVAHKGGGSVVKIIGNIIEDQWFDAESFFNEPAFKGTENEDK